SPGPACYGRGGTEPTVTDAQFILHRLSPAGLIGGELALNANLARSALSRIAEPLGLAVETAALGVIAVLEQNMIGGIQAAAARHGDDVRDFALLAGGGAGPMHDGAPAPALGVSSVIVPARPGLLSALGLLGAAIRHDAARSLLSVE